MELTLIIKLKPNPYQATVLLQTIEQVNAACNAVAEVAFQEKTANRIRLVKLTYHNIRKHFGLPSRLADLAIRKAINTYARDKSKRAVFRKRGAIIYEKRSLSWKGQNAVSILTLQGRQVIPIAFGQYQADKLKLIRDSARLIYRNGKFYLQVTADVPEQFQITPNDWLGVDFGIVNIAADSDGTIYSGALLNNLRKRYAKLRAKLQSKGTKSAKRLLKRRSGKEKRFVRNINHIISKMLIAKAKGTRRGIALENLKGIRNRVTVRKAQRRNQHSWAFHQLRIFIQYKARLAGIPVILVDPKHTSRTCPECGYVDKRNRPNRDTFQCIGCGFAGPADTIAARNISLRAGLCFRAAIRGGVKL